MITKNTFTLISFAIIAISSCNNDTEIAQDNIDNYKGTASISKGSAAVINENIFDCFKGRKAPIGISTALDSTTWAVPADVNFASTSFPFASDLFNPCTGMEYQTTEKALAAIDGTDIVEVDSDGEVITAFVFADNYFEMYINGVPVGKDNVPFTQFNSNIVRFKAQKPFTITMKLVDWEENSGLGTESNKGNEFHAGDGGMVAVFKDTTGEIIATTNSNWKAQTYYTAPLADLSCASENGTLRLSDNCNTETSGDGNSYYALHWKVPTGWQNSDFDDSEWPSATEFTNAEIGVDNKPAYTNFTDVFDDTKEDAKFIWSTNVVLDNEVIVRYTVK